MLRYNDVKRILFVAPGNWHVQIFLCKYALCNYVMMLKFSTFVSYVLDKILEKAHKFIRYFEEVTENVSMISEQPS
jgi:hypothetical protein